MSRVPFVMAAYALANFLAYARDAVIASTFGASAATDAYFVGSFLPILVAAVLLQGALVPAFLPILAAHLAPVNRDGVLSRIVAVVGPVLCLLVLAAEIWAELVVHVIAPSWTGDQLATASSVLRIGMLSTIPVGLSALLTTVSSVRGQYMLQPLGVIVSNATAAVITVVGGPQLGIAAAALGLTVGSVLQLALGLGYVGRIGVRLRRSGAAPAGVLVRLSMAFLPMLAYSTSAQIVPVVERVLASELPPGQLSQLTYALKLAIIPLTVITTANGIVYFVGMSRDSVANDLAALRRTLVRGTRFTVFLLVLATAALIGLSQPIVRLSLQRGGFSEGDAAATAQLLMIYAFGIVPNGVIVLLTRSFQARGSNWAVVRASVATSLAYLVAAVTLFRVYGPPGLAAAFGVSQLAGIVLLQLQQPSELRILGWRDSAVILTFAGLALGTAALALLMHWTIGLLGGTGVLWNAGVLGAGAAILVGCILALARLLGVESRWT
jgi:putative peptidoglycan lipid II flippase